MEILREFGVNPILLTAQVVNFLVILYLLKRFMYKPVLEVLKNRERTIKEGLQKAEEAQKLLDKTKDEEKVVLKNAQLHVQKLLEEAKLHAQTIEKNAEERTRQQSEKMLEDAREQIQREAKTAQKILTRQVTRVAADLLRKTITGIMTDRDRKEFMEKAVQVLKKKPK